VTRLIQDALRRTVATRDPAGRTVQQQWCGCGALDALIDANGHATRWERDSAARVVREVRADGVTATGYTYDALGRLATVTDPKQQVTTYTYNVDGSLGAVGYTNAQIATPGVTWTYDPAYARITTMLDGTGTTAYTYHATGQFGAGQLATVDGPLANDVISYTYDELGRVVARAIDGVPLT
jgi:YD repeat-containing protein